MSDNQNKNNVTRIKILLSGIPAVICSWFIPFKKGRIIINSHFNTEFSFNSKFLFLYLVKNGYDVWFVINNDDYRNQLSAQYGNHFIETNTFKGKIFALRSRLWFVSAFEMPVGGVFLKNRRKVIHLTHGSLIKNVGLLEKDVSFIKRIYYKICVYTNISYSIATSDFFVPSTAGYVGIPEKKVLVTGFPRNDALFSTDVPEPEILKKTGFRILYAPTWRKSEDTQLFPFADMDYQIFNKFLEENDITVFIRLHPNCEDALDKSILSERIKLFSSSECKEIMDTLVYFDALITDYSSIAYDFLLLDRPMMFLPYDYETYDRNIGFAVDYSQITPGFKPQSFKDFLSGMLDMETKDTFAKQRREVCALCNTYKDNNSERLINRLKDMKIKGF